MVHRITSMGNNILAIGTNMNSSEKSGCYVINNDIKKTLKKTRDSVIVFNQDGQIVLVNEMAARYFLQDTDKIIGQNAWDVIPMQKLAHKRLFLKAAKYFQQAKSGIPQQFNWVEYLDKRPVQAFDVILNSLTLHNEPVIVARLIDITQAKILEWVLWSLAEISNHGGINDVIDDITRLASNVFHTDHACVILIDSSDTAHSVSYYRHGAKQPNITYPLQGTPCQDVKKTRSIYHFNGDVQTHYPDASILKELNVHSYIGGPLINSEGQIVGILTLFSETSIDVNKHNRTLFQLFSERVCLEIERLLSHRKLQFLASIPQQDPNPVLRLQSGGSVLYSNSSGKKILEYWNKLFHGLPRQLLDACGLAKKNRDVVRVEMDVADKVYFFIIVWIADFDQVNIYATDITELKRVQQRMRDLANYDTLTNLANRQFFDTTLSLWIERAKKNKEELALLLIDIDNFKTINDTLGHQIGDILLKNVAKRMSGCLRKNDFIARLGGDEFVVILAITNQTDIEKVAGKINQALSDPFEFGEYHLETACSIGICYYPGGGSNAGDLMRNADMAMYQAKKNGKNQYAIYSDKGFDEVSNRLIFLKKDLKKAISRQEFYIDYQPQFDLLSGKIIGYEAFIRWRHPEKGLISPGEFIPLAEQTGSIHSLGYWTIEQALKDFSTTRTSVSDTKISLNIALSQLSDQNFIDNLCNSMVNANIPKESVVLDIAEQISTIQYRHLDTNLEVLHSEGIRLSLDNFGAQHSNLNRLLEIPFNYIKIAQNLLHSLDQHPRQGAFISGIIELAHKLDLLVIQKGVENAEQNDMMKQLGCHYAQGYYYCRPLSINALQEFIERYESRD
ncbi:GGDEF domain-containing sensory box protein [Legionella spiritensis]|uniref:GGDEF domain-containing sensory box protein n=3 Tax=Legionella spiritensis TaxID=452 RepID=A0A0W0ZBG0_LEGSP|nr:GGDEF domain-containing sensory box protein [Legionella spiritensis]SNV44080.1 signal transduction protein containing a membrane domain, an EAL and a GGDEF domain [Legionella spiritensis]